MAGEPYITVIGNLAADPELRFTANGTAVANFTIAQTPRTFNREQNTWVDDETLWVRGSLWREAAENVAETLTKGTRVIAHGRLKARSFETKDGQQRTNWELEVDEIGPSLKWATAKVQRTSQGAPQDQSQAAATQDPWAQNPAQNNGGSQTPPPGGQNPSQTPPAGSPQTPGSHFGTMTNQYAQGQPAQPPQAQNQGNNGWGQPPTTGDVWGGGTGDESAPPPF